MRLFSSTRQRGAFILIAAMSSLAFASSASAAPTPPFTQCPAIGLDTSCAVLIEITPSGEAESFTDPTQGPFDGVEDTLIGVQNNSKNTVETIKLKTGSLPIPIFGFDGDGLCSAFISPKPAGCPFGPTGYEGPKTSFTIENANEGNVNFLEGTVAPGGSAYFSLEGPVTLHCTKSKLECEGGEKCTTVIGSGQFRPPGEVQTVDNEVEVGGGKHVFEYSWENRTRHLRLTKLETSECLKSPSESRFSGHGTANVNGKTGYEITFTFTISGGKTNLVLVLEKGGVVQRTFADEPLITTQLQRERIF
ncbi:MAG: hypothetical protein M3Z95_05610 [Actinomycetota bacterium]|nr:hypothetical protein [Actinomycetota bacterium]